jgi:hypothetical protein
VLVLLYILVLHFLSLNLHWQYSCHVSTALYLSVITLQSLPNMLIFLVGILWSDFLSSYTTFYILLCRYIFLPLKFFSLSFLPTYSYVSFHFSM